MLPDKFQVTFKMKKLAPAEVPTQDHVTPGYRSNQVSYQRVSITLPCFNLVGVDVFNIEIPKHSSVSKL